MRDLGTKLQCKHALRAPNVSNGITYDHLTLRKGKNKRKKNRSKVTSTRSHLQHSKGITRQKLIMVVFSMIMLTKLEPVYRCGC